MSEVSYVFINGLGDGSPKWHERLAQKRWRLGGVDLKHIPVNWFEDRPFDEFHAEIVEQVEAVAEETGKVALIGSSAGASEAINVFFDLKDKVNICVIPSHGRLADGGYPDNHRMSMYNRADMDKPGRSSRLFVESVSQLENDVTPNLTEADKNRMLILTQLTDMIVPMDTTLIDGVSHYRSKAFGHSGGFLAHFLADKGIIENFAERVLADR